MQRVRKMQSKCVLWKSNSLEKSPRAYAMVIVAADRSTHSITHTHALRQDFAVCRIHTLMHNVQPRKMLPSSSTKKRHRQEIPCIGTPCLLRSPRASLTSTMTTVIARVLLSATEDVRDAGQRIFLSHTLLLDLPNPEAARHAVALHNSQRPHAPFPTLLQDVYHPFRSRHQGRDCHQGISLDPTTDQVATL